MRQEALAMLEAVRVALGGVTEEGVREKLLAVLLELEEDLVQALELPEDRQARVLLSIDAKLIGLLELTRLEVVKAKREFMLGAVRAAFAFARQLILKAP